MPTYNVYYYVVKQPPFPVEGSSGELTLTNPDSPDARAARDLIFANFRDILQTLMQRSAEYIPHESSRNQTVEVIEIPSLSPGVPDFSGVTIQMSEPLVYVVYRPPSGARPEENPTNPTERRPSLVMLRALDNNYQEFSSSQLSSARSAVGAAQDQLGFALGYSDYAPMVAEVFSNPQMAWAAANWKEILANYLAKGAFHEIAHCKAECANRASNPRWRQAISGSIHDYQDEGTAVAVCLPQIAWGAEPSTADLRLMGKHMLCPLPFYRLDEEISPQCFHHGQLTPLTQPATLAPQPSDTEDPLDDFNI